jgi:DNA-binding HxlR family transcriptional regulator
MNTIAPPVILQQDCPVRRVLRLVGDKWSPLVLHCLSTGPWRYNDLRRAIPDISQKMLTQVLRELETAGLVRREVYELVPPKKTEYHLTETGMRLHEPLALLCHWANANVPLLNTVEAAARADQPA